MNCHHCHTDQYGYHFIWQVTSHYHKMCYSLEIALYFIPPMRKLTCLLFCFLQYAFLNVDREELKKLKVRNAPPSDVKIIFFLVIPHELVEVFLTGNWGEESNLHT